MINRVDLPSWKLLADHAKEMKGQHIRTLFNEHENRFADFSITLAPFLLDYSKNLISTETMQLLFSLAKDCEVELWRKKMFSGEPINRTEGRAVLHTALRNKSQHTIYINGEEISTAVQDSLIKMEIFCKKVREGHWRGYSGKRITDVVNIGVGGSNLGPQMVTEALKQYSDNSVNVHYVSNVDGTQIANILRPLNPESVLFIVSSKTFTTTETMKNAQTAMKWLTSSSFDAAAIEKHFIAVSANKANATEFGILEENIFVTRDWVGGRCSWW